MSVALPAHCTNSQLFLKSLAVSSSSVRMVTSAFGSNSWTDGAGLTYYIVLVSLNYIVYYLVGVLVDQYMARIQ